MAHERRLTFTDVPGVRVGHYTDETAMTGCTVVLAENGGAVAAVDVRGYAPGTQMTDMLDPRIPGVRAHAIVLTGGSVFGLAACAGVTAWLEERGIGHPYRGWTIPMVPAAVVYDLSVGDGQVRPTAQDGYRACAVAESGAGLLEGSVGAGTGASVGKLLGMDRCMKGGVGGAAIRLADGTVVGALAVTNAVGDVLDERGSVLAGARSEDGGFVDSVQMLLREGRPPIPTAGGNTTLAVIATDARLAQAECQRIAGQAHDALAMAVVPVHTILDGDAVFTLSTGERDVDTLIVGVAAVAALREAILRSVRLARGLGGIPGLADVAE